MIFSHKGVPSSVQWRAPTAQKRPSVGTVGSLQDERPEGVRMDPSLLDGGPLRSRSPCRTVHWMVSLAQEGPENAVSCHLHSFTLGLFKSCLGGVKMI